MAADQSWSTTWTFFDGQWREGNVPLWGARTHAIWLGSSVFDGARVFEGVAPDLDLHCARVNASAKTMYLKPSVAVDEWLALARDGMAKFPKDTTLYVRPMYWAERASPMALPPDAESTRFALSLWDAPMRKPDGFSVTLSPFRRPTRETAPVDAKAGCLYPNNARAMFEAKSRGFDNCLVRDANGNIAELANSNVFMAKDGVVFTPISNGTFLAGITRRRVIGLLRDAGATVNETVLRYEDFESADEMFSTGNASKVLPITRIGERSLQPGPLYRKARELYWAFAHG
jgi:branched-chain amino acid aminotransferase